VAKGDGVLELHRNATIGETILSRPPSPGHCIDNRPKNNPNLPMKKAYLLRLELQPERQASGFPHS